MDDCNILLFYDNIDHMVFLWTLGLCFATSLMNLLNVIIAISIGLRILMIMEH